MLSQAADGSRSVVSHANKAAKGRLARALLEDPAPGARSAADAAERLARAAERAGLRVERTPAGLDLVEERVPPVSRRRRPQVRRTTRATRGT